MPPQPAQWYESKRLWSLVLFFLLLAAYIALRWKGVEVPEWITVGAMAALGALQGGVGLTSKRPVSLRRPGVAKEQPGPEPAITPPPS